MKHQCPLPRLVYMYILLNSTMHVYASLEKSPSVNSSEHQKPENENDASLMAATSDMFEFMLVYMYRRSRIFHAKNISCWNILLYLIFVADDPCCICLYGDMNIYFILWLVLTTKIS